MKLLKKQRKGNKPNRAQPITDSELDILYESNLLSGSSLEALLNSKWFNFLEFLLSVEIWYVSRHPQYSGHI
jgi:hypothetical protein